MEAEENEFFFCLPILPCDGHSAGRDCDTSGYEGKECVYNLLAKELGDSSSLLSYFSANSTLL